MQHYTLNCATKHQTDMVRSYSSSD